MLCYQHQYFCLVVLYIIKFLWCRKNGALHKAYSYRSVSSVSSKLCLFPQKASSHLLGVFEIAWTYLSYCHLHYVKITWHLNDSGLWTWMLDTWKTIIVNVFQDKRTGQKIPNHTIWSQHTHQTTQAFILLHKLFFIVENNQLCHASYFQPFLF